MLNLFVCLPAWFVGLMISSEENEAHLHFLFVLGHQVKYRSIDFNCRLRRVTVSFHWLILFSVHLSYLSIRLNQYLHRLIKMSLKMTMTKKKRLQSNLIEWNLCVLSISLLHISSGIWPPPSLILFINHSFSFPSIHTYINKTTISMPEANSIWPYRQQTVCQPTSQPV